MLGAGDGFRALVGDDKYLRTERALFDEWERGIIPIAQEGQIVGAMSLGKDGISGSSDDIVCKVDGP